MDHARRTEIKLSYLPLLADGRVGVSAGRPRCHRRPRDESANGLVQRGERVEAILFQRPETLPIKVGLLLDDEP